MKTSGEMYLYVISQCMYVYTTKLVLRCWLNLIADFELYFDSCVNSILNLSAVVKVLNILRHSLICQRK